MAKRKKRKKLKKSKKRKIKKNRKFKTKKSHLKKTKRLSSKLETFKDDEGNNVIKVSDVWAKTGYANKSKYQKNIMPL